jgi:hypothetical protein
MFQVLTAVAMNISIVFSGIERHVFYITNDSKKHTASHLQGRAIKVVSDNYGEADIIEHSARPPPSTTISQWPASKTAIFAVLAP